MKRALVLLAAGFEEIEAVTVIDVLRRAGIAVRAAGLAAGPCRGSRGITVVPDCTLDEALADPEGYDALVLPGGGPGAKALRSDDGAARVVVDGRRITSQAPGTAMEFAYALVERLCDRAKVLELEAGILWSVQPSGSRVTPAAPKPAPPRAKLRPKLRAPVKAKAKSKKAARSR